MFEVGDVVSVLDIDGGVYYGVAQGFLLDQYAHKLVLLTWLLPKSPNPMHFDPAMFILGKSECDLIKLERKYAMDEQVQKMTLPDPWTRLNSCAIPHNPDISKVHTCTISQQQKCGSLQTVDHQNRYKSSYKQVIIMQEFSLYIAIH